MIKALAAEGVGPVYIARQLGVARSSVYRVLSSPTQRRALWFIF
jgi:hypothetical protein